MFYLLKFHNIVSQFYSIRKSVLAMSLVFWEILWYWSSLMPGHPKDQLNWKFAKSGVKIRMIKWTKGTMIYGIRANKASEDSYCVLIFIICEMRCSVLHYKTLGLFITPAPWSKHAEWINNFTFSLVVDPTILLFQC